VTSPVTPERSYYKTKTAGTFKFYSTNRGARSKSRIQQVWAPHRCCRRLGIHFYTNSRTPNTRSKFFARRDHVRVYRHG